MLTFAEQQKLVKRSRFDGVIMFALCAFIMTLLCVAFSQAYNVPDVRDVPMKAIKKARAKRCTVQAQELAQATGEDEHELIMMCI